MIVKVQLTICGAIVISFGALGSQDFALVTSVCRISSASKA